MTDISSVLRLVIVVDNLGGAGLVEEHGFAAWLEVAGRRILFDTGQGQACIPNAAALGCDLNRLDTLVLSHGHYDHGGALPGVLPLAPAAAVYCHTGVMATRYSVPPGAPPRPVSLPPAAIQALLGLPPHRLHRIAGPWRLAPGVGLSGSIPRVHPLEDTGGPFFLDPDRSCVDPLDDDQALWIETGHGLIILTGCCHAGLINTVAHVRAVSGIDRICAIVGGLHLQNAGAARLAATCAALRAWRPEAVVPCHCTGPAAVARLRAELGAAVVPGHAGLGLTATGRGSLEISPRGGAGDVRP